MDRMDDFVNYQKTLQALVNLTKKKIGVSERVDSLTESLNQVGRVEY